MFNTTIQFRLIKVKTTAKIIKLNKNKCFFCRHKEIVDKNKLTFLAVSDGFSGYSLKLFERTGRLSTKKKVINKNCKQFFF